MKRCGYVSNTLAGSGNQLWFTPAPGIHTTRIFYRPFAHGRLAYRFLFTNTIDSTYADGAISRANMPGGEWTLHTLHAFVCADSRALFRGALPPKAAAVRFEGRNGRTVFPGDAFFSDPVELETSPGEAIGLQLSFSGTQIPYHEELLVPAYEWKQGVYQSTCQTPLPGMVACGRTVKKRIAFWGDSITQGIGTERGSYDHWAAQAASMLGGEYAFWNLGIGYGRAADAASGGAWMKKARHTDLLCVCFGVNDLLQGRSEEQIKGDLRRLAQQMRPYCEVIFFTVPPFNWQGAQIGCWRNINRYILTELSRYVACVFDVTPVLGMGAEQSHIARYGAHPNREGCRKLAEAFVSFLAERSVL